MLPAQKVRPRRVLPAFAAVVATLAATLASCNRAAADGKSTNAGDLKRREPARVRVAQAERREMTKRLSTTTVVESEKEVRIIPRAAGTVMELMVEEGDHVEAGAVLAVLDQRESQALLDEARVLFVQAQDDVLKGAIGKREAEARVGRTKRSFEQSNRDYERNEKADLISQQALDQLRLARDTAQGEHEAALLAVERSAVEEKAAGTNLEKSRLGLQRQELEHSYTRITAPFSGVIASRRIKVGDFVSPSSQSFTTSSEAFVLTDADHLRAQFHRPQRELSMFLEAVRHASEGGNGGSAKARPIEIRGTAEALPGRRISGEILLVSPSIEAQSGSFRVTVRLHLEPADDVSAASGVSGVSGASARSEAAAAIVDRARLLPGMLVRLEIVTDRHPEALVVPKRALKREGEASLVIVVREGLARRVRVEEGFSDDESVEVIPVAPATLEAGEPVVVVGNRDLEEGGEVAVEGAEEGSPPAAGTAEGSASPAEQRQE